MKHKNLLYITQDAEIEKIPDAAEVVYLPHSKILRLNTVLSVQALLLPHNLINSQDFTGFANMRLLDLSDNSLTSLSFINLPQSLRFLKLDCNNIKNAELSHLPELTSVSLNRCLFSRTMALTPPPSVECIFMRGNLIEEVAPWENAASLRVLDLRNNIIRGPAQFSPRVRVLYGNNYV